MDITSARMRYQTEEVALSYDRVRFSFTNPRGCVIDFLEKRAIRKALDAVLRELPSPRVLDIPCGTGRITELLLERGLKVTGGDIALPMLEVAHDKLSPYGNQVALRLMDAEALDLPDRSFDLVTCIRLFNHLRVAERKRALSELARVCRGFVIVNVSFTSPAARPAILLKPLAGVPKPKEPSTWAEIQGQVAAAGLRIADYYYELRHLSEVMVLLLRKV